MEPLYVDTSRVDGTGFIWDNHEGTGFILLDARERFFVAELDLES